MSKIIICELVILGSILFGNYTSSSTKEPDVFHLPLNDGYLPISEDKDFRTNISQDQRIKVIATVFAESLGEGNDGQHAVVNVIFNRANNNHETIYDVISKPYQFSAFNVNNNLYSRARDFLRGKIDISNNEKNVIERISNMVDNCPIDITNGADHYLRIEHSSDLSWIDASKMTYKIGNHTFYKLY